VAVTAGYICPEPRRELYHDMDAANVDLKGFTERFYHKVFCGGHLTPVLDGVRYAYTGNVHDPAGASTYCHACGAVLVGRDWYVLSDWNLCVDGRCSSCGTPCAGVFEQRPGQWGPKRVPVQLREPLLH
jgi:hypothetical protein